MIYVNDKPVNTTMFPDNTSQVWKLPVEEYGDKVVIRWKYSNEGEVMQLGQLAHLLNHLEIAYCLQIDYLPYARQDKEIDNNATFALEVLADYLNSLNFTEVYIDDPHSDRALQLINNSIPTYPAEALDKVMFGLSFPLICYPDSGAVNKYSHIYQHQYTWSVKKRDQATGAILSTSIAEPDLVKGQEVLIVDDICDGGRTFIELSAELYKAGATAVHLFVTHGLFTKGLRVLREAGILDIYTAKGLVKDSDLQKGI